MPEALPSFVQRVITGLSCESDTLRAAERKQGRPQVYHACPDCAEPMTARELRAHNCEGKLRRIQEVEMANCVRRNLKWCKNVARVAARKLPPSVDLEDLEQIAACAMMDASRKYDRTPRAGYSRPTPFRAYAWRPVYYSCIMAYRGRHFRDVTHEPLTEVKAVIDGEAQAQQARTRQLLSEAILTLPPIQSAILSLHYLKGMTICETAEELHVRPEWASTQHQEGLAALRNHLAARGIHGINDWL